MIKKLLSINLILIALFTFNSYSQQDEITVEELKAHVMFLASDSLKGRKPGTQGGFIAADYVRAQLIENDIELIADNGFQYFDVVTGVELGGSNYFQHNDLSFKPGDDYIPLAFTENAKAEAPAVFAGYGLVIDSDSLQWDSYENISADGKWVIVLLGDPEYHNRSSKFEEYASIRQKVLNARDRNAAGIILVAGENYSSDDVLMPLRYDRIQSNAGLPVVQASRKTADRIIELQGMKITDIEKKIISGNEPVYFEIDGDISIQTDVRELTVKTQNVVGMLPGNDPSLKNEYIVLGGHYDHLGMGGFGSGSRKPDTIAVHNGADDNGSGTASIIEIIEKASANRDKFKRSILFVAFGAEEMGIQGSNYFAEHPLVDLKDIKFMLNIDMIGRVNPGEDPITIYGTGTAEGLEDLLAEITGKDEDSFRFSPEGFGPSDHASFYSRDIPVLSFFGVPHDDYHTPEDDWDKLNYSGIKKTSGLVYDIMLDLANREQNLAFKEAGPKSRPGGNRYNLKVTLGIMPDHVADTEGLKIAAVMEGRPAARAGMEKGDVIVAMDGKAVKDIYDYMSRLKTYRPGDRVNVDVMRGGKKRILIVEF